MFAALFCCTFDLIWRGTSLQMLLLHLHHAVRGKIAHRLMVRVDSGCVFRISLVALPVSYGTLVTLFVIHYNFPRPHMSLNYKTPIELPELDNITNILGKWTKIPSLAA